MCQSDPLNDVALTFLPFSTKGTHLELVLTQFQLSRFRYYIAEKCCCRLRAIFISNYFV